MRHFVRNPVCGTKFVVLDDSRARLELLTDREFGWRGMGVVPQKPLLDLAAVSRARGGKVSPAVADWLARFRAMDEDDRSRSPCRVPGVKPWR
jgi:hypothetical protein